MTTIKKTFNKAASTYNDHCYLQKQTGETLIALVQKHHHNTSHILDLGCGTGIVTAQLAKALSFQTFLGVDIANQLLQEATLLLKPFSIQLLEADFNEPFSFGKFDIIFSNMALHWSQDFPMTLHSLLKNLTEKGILAFSIPLSGTFAEIKNLVATQEFMTESQVKAHLEQQGYQFIATHIRTIPLRFSHLLAALQSIKKVGATHVKHRSFRLSNLRQALQSTYDTVLTYHIGFFIVHSI